MSPHELFDGGPAGASAEIAEDTFAVNAPFWGFPNVVYFLRSGSGWALIDTGISETPAVAIAPFLEAHGGYDRLELVLGTHGHLDHIGGNSWVKAKAPRARFALGAFDSGWAEDIDKHFCDLYVHGAPGPWRPDAATEANIRSACGEPVAIDHPLVGGEVLAFGMGRQIAATHLGSHSPGQMLYTDLLTRCVFSGDAVQGAGVLNSNSGERDFPMYRTPVDYLRSLETIREELPAVLCTAHEGVHSGAAIEELLRDAERWTLDFDTILLQAASALGAFSLEELVPELGRRMPGYALALQVRVTAVQHLDGLVRRGLLTPVIESGEKRWRNARQS